MSDKKSDFQSLSLLSGKGGSGKTVIALSMCRVLSEAGFKVLLIDCDTATHGATYFFESELELNNERIISISQLMSDHALSGSPLSTKAGFDFIPSTVNPAQIQHEDISNSIANIADSLNVLFPTHIKDYDIVIFDCQAGYSAITKWVAEASQRNLIVLEADAVSSAALRVLYLQIGNALKTSNTWQVFNKLTEDERRVYEKVSGGTFFPNLPPIPFDWQVRALFAVCEIPSVTSKGSAFSLGVLRLMQTVLPESSDRLANLENEAVGEWYQDIANRLAELEDRKTKTRDGRLEATRRRLLLRTRYVTILALFAASSIGFVGYMGAMRLLWPVIGAAVGALAVGWRFVIVTDVRTERKQYIARESIIELDAEIERFRTLITTDPRLREYSRKKDAEAHEKVTKL